MPTLVLAWCSWKEEGCSFAACQWTVIVLKDATDCLYSGDSDIGG